MNKQKPGPKPSRLVEPIKTLEDIEKVKKLLQLKPQELLMFCIGINSALRVKELLELQAKDILEAKEENKHSSLILTKSVTQAFEYYSQINALRPNDYLFSKKKSSDPIKGGYATYLVKKWCSDCNVKGNFGAQSLRKTFGYIQRVYYGADIGLLATLFGHNCPSITLKYLCISSRDHYNLVSI